MIALMAEYEAAPIKERTVAGLAAARSRGRDGGRTTKITPHLIDKAQRINEASGCTTPGSSPWRRSPPPAASRHDDLPKHPYRLSLAKLTGTIRRRMYRITGQSRAIT
jgi:hypothetical protein